MLLQFPDADTLMLAMSSGTIPESIVASPLEYARDDEGAYWVDTGATMPQTATSRLKKWGVTVHRSHSKLKVALQEATSWLQMLPLQKDQPVQQISDRTQVLFVLRDESLLPSLVNEILRLGNDRQSFRRVDWSNQTRILLRVIGAPYYSLLRATESWTADASLRVFVERSPRVWIAFGNRHPLENRLVPAAGEHLLSDANGDWISLQEQPFQDVYTVLEFKLPEQPEPLVDSGQVRKLEVPLRLSRGSGKDAAEVMVLTQDAVGQLERFVQAANDAVQECFNAMSGLLKSLKNADAATLEALEKHLSRSFITLRKLGMRNEIAFLLEAMSKVVRGALKSPETETERLRILLQLAGGWFDFGQDHGWKDIDAARTLLLGGRLVEEGHVGTKKQTDVAISYIRAVGQAPLRDAVDRLQDLFQHLTGIRDGQTVSSHYSLKHLDIVEALVQTIVSDSFTMDKNSLRWMDEEEFLIRRKIHQDMRKMMNDP